MSSDTPSHADPLIDEVRQRRRELFADCDNDLMKLWELIQRIQATHPHKVIDRRSRKLAELKAAVPQKGETTPRS